MSFREEVEVGSKSLSVETGVLAGLAAPSVSSRKMDAARNSDVARMC